MRVAIVGNSGSGKSSLARALSAIHGIEALDLDTLVWEREEPAVQRPLEAVLRDLTAWVGLRDRWVVEGCYAELIEAVLPQVTELLFLDPGLETCLAHNRQRPWEPHKYADKAAQDAMLPQLQTWIAGYYTRDDPWSFVAHRALYERYTGSKQWLRDAADYR